MRKSTLAVILTGWLLTYGIVQPSTSYAQDRTSQILTLVNGLRSGNGLPGYTIDASLMAAAQAHASWMASTGQYGHTGESGSTPQSRANTAGYSGYVMENYVLGTGMAPNEALTWWDNSPVHHRTMLASDGYTQFGAGTAVRDRMIIYVLLVGKPSSGPAASVSGGNNAAEPEEPEPVNIVIPVTRAEPREDGSIVHEVQMGQTFWDIAAVYEVDLAELLWINGKQVGDYVKPGDQIIVQLAEGQLPPHTPMPPNTHTVQEGDSLWEIAARYRVDFEQMLLINGLQVGDIVIPGDEIILFLRPGETPPPTPTPPLYYTVNAGETVWEIAVNHGLTVDQLLDMNEMQRPAIIKEGDQLLIRQPDPTATPTPEPTMTPTAPPPVTPTMPPTEAPTEPAPTPDTTSEAELAPHVSEQQTTPTSAPAQATETSPTVAASATLTTAVPIAAAASATTTPHPAATNAIQPISTNVDSNDDGNPGLILGLLVAAIILLAGLAVGVAIYYLK